MMFAAMTIMSREDDDPSLASRAARALICATPQSPNKRCMKATQLCVQRSLHNAPPPVSKYCSLGDGSCANDFVIALKDGI